MPNLQSALLQLLATAEPPEPGPGPRAGVRPEPELESSLGQLLAGSRLSLERQTLIRALVLLWHDHLEAAHRLAQEVAGADGAFVHGIMHRREPDYSNAAYWFRRAGAHPAFGALARQAAPELSDCADLRRRLLPAGRWDPFGFIDLCEEAAGWDVDAAPRAVLRRLQRIETEALLEYFCSAAGAGD